MKNKKKRLVNKIIYVSFLIFVTSIFSSKILNFKFNELIKSEIVEENVATNKSLVEEVDGKLTYIGPDIRILEIEPADSFKLTDIKNTRVTTGTETVKRTENSKEYKIEITHMTMAEFIGKTEQLNGKYDVIVIGRYVDKTLQAPNGAINYTNDKQGTAWFRDYVDLENDITNKKANEIKEFIESGQLVYIDKDIKSMNGSKIYYHTINSEGAFNQTVDNLINNLSVTGNNNNITIDSILKKYIERININNSFIRPNIFSTAPVGDTYDEELGDINKRNMVFNISSKELKDENLTLNLYLDINGDGLFKEDEIVKTEKNINFYNGEYKLTYNLYEDFPLFIGYLDWRIEVVKNKIDGYSESIKSYYDGNILFRRLTEEKRIINVLQISHFDRDTVIRGNTTSVSDLNLLTNEKFQELLKSKEVQDYIINIDVISYSDFYIKENTYNGPKEGDYWNIVKDLLIDNNEKAYVELNNTKYDMIIMGFADVNNAELISKEGTNQLKEYVKVGKSLMLTHDTLTYWRNGWNIRNSTNFMSTFRDEVGQSRYIDPNNSDALDFNGNIINHDPNGITVSQDKNEWQYQNEYMKEAGATFLNRGISAGDTESTIVYKTNKSLLTSYPFNLGDEIRVRKTHGQYFQLNLEDEDVVPVFNLSEINTKEQWWTSYNKNNKYDSRNFYYTYTRGNITFSGTGENSREWIEYPYEEMQLFVNTIVKAERGANHKPIISGLNEEEITSVPYNKDFNFSIVVKDVDKDKVKLNKILVNGQDISSSNNLSNEYEESGAIYSLKISKELLSTPNQELTITLEAEDDKKAISIKEYKIKTVSDAIIVPKIVYKDLTVNEKLSFTIDLETENDSNPTSININNVTKPEGHGIFNIENIEVIKENGKLKLAINDLIAYQKEKGREINIPITYSTNNNTKNVAIKIIYNSDYTRVETTGINHGLYIENSKGEFIIKENVDQYIDGFEFLSGLKEKITFAAQFITSNYEETLNLNIDDNFYTVMESDIKVYKVTNVGLEEINMNNVEGQEKEPIKSLGNNDFEIYLKDLSKDSNTSTNILIVYKAKLKEDFKSGSLINNITLNKNSKDIKIKVLNEDEEVNLPDLF